MTTINNYRDKPHSLVVPYPFLKIIRVVIAGFHLFIKTTKAEWQYY